VLLCHDIEYIDVWQSIVASVSNLDLLLGNVDRAPSNEALLGRYDNVH
jgi:hypothetical protein